VEFVTKFYYRFLAECTRERVLKIGQYLAKIGIRVCCRFLTRGVDIKMVLQNQLYIIKFNNILIILVYIKLNLYILKNFFTFLQHVQYLFAANCKPV